jgi:acyl carrier protein
MRTTVEPLREILVKDYNVDPDSLTLETPLEVLGIDSLGVAELLFTVEEEFKVRVSTESQRCPAVILAEAGKLAHETASAPLYADNGVV